MVDTSNWPNLLVCTIYTTWTSTTGADGCSLAPALTYSGQWRPGADRVKEHFELSSNHGHVNPQSKSYFLLLLSERIRLIRWSWEQVIFKGKVICHLSRLIAELPALCPSTCQVPPATTSIVRTYSITCLLLRLKENATVPFRNNTAQLHSSNYSSGAHKKMKE